MKSPLHVPVRPSQFPQLTPTRGALTPMLPIAMEEQPSRQPVQAPAQLGTAGPLGELSIRVTPLLLGLDEVVWERSHDLIQSCVRFIEPARGSHSAARRRLGDAPERAVPRIADTASALPPALLAARDRRAAHVPGRTVNRTAGG
jgi:hypothetical protein